MKMKHLIFAMLTLATASSFTGCNDSTPTPEEPINDDDHLLYCTPCENEKVVDTLINQEATVVVFNSGFPQAEDIYILSTQEMSKEGNGYAISMDSIFLPCPAIPKELRKINKKVTVSVYRTNCRGILIPADARTGFGTKTQLISIKSN
jgi:hypothetical protein